MRAGRHDDNKQYNRFLGFLDDNKSLIPFPIDISERLLLRTTDRDGRSLPNCKVTVKDLAGKGLGTTTTYADGRTMFFPKNVGPNTSTEYVVEARCGQDIRNGQLARSGRRQSELRFKRSRELAAQIPVDLAIVLDTTGSMQSQIDRLKDTLKAIHFQLTQLPSRPNIRFALVAYRDEGDDYVTRVTPFTAEVNTFQGVVDGLDADGGGDIPEDLQSGLQQAMHTLKWRDDGVRLGFIVADAPPHTDYGQSYNYAKAMRESLQRGIKWTSVGAGGLPRAGEVVFRQIAQFTMGEYVFVTQGAVGDSDGGRAEASHHVGSNYRTENLDQAIVRIVRRELSYLTDQPKDFDDTLVATANPGVPREQVLGPAVKEVLRQLVDYSSLSLDPKTPVAIVPLTCKQKDHGAVAEYLTDQMVLSATRHPSLTVVERDLEAVAQEIRLQLSDLFDVAESVEIGKMVGAEALVVSKLTVRGSDAELFAKLIRVSTGEVLSVARVTMATAILLAANVRP